MPPKLSIRLKNANNNPGCLMIAGNIALATGKPSKAVDIYTEILYKHVPGHPCAFLNRSLAYLALCLPELAVTDAYRAGIAIEDMRTNTLGGYRRNQATSSYLRIESLEIASAASWCSEERRFISGEWLCSPLASIVINDIPDTQGQRIDPSKREELCDSLEIRAVYRLCGFLGMCGQGARYEVLGLIDDAMRSCRKLEGWEKADFNDLGNDVMHDLVNESQGKESMPSPESSTNTRLQDGQCIGHDYKGSRTAYGKLEGYQWDVFASNFTMQEWQESLKDWVGDQQNCTTRVVDYLDNDEKLPKLSIEFVAVRDIAAGELVLSEEYATSVTTSIPEEVVDKRVLQSKDTRLYCDTCASLLIVPGTVPVRFEGSISPIVFSDIDSQNPSVSPVTADTQLSSDSGKVSSGTNGRSTPEVSRDNSKFYPNTTNPQTSGPSLSTSLPDGDKPRIDNDPKLTSCSNSPRKSGSDQSSSSKSPAISKSQSPQSSSPSIPERSGAESLPDITYCCMFQKVPTCCSACAIVRSDLEHILCLTRIEYDLRISYLRDYSLKPMPQRKIYCLRDLLFVRTFITAFKDEEPVLQQPSIAFATCGPVHRQEQPKQAWSFTDNVIRPIHYLNSYFKSKTIDPFGQLDETDGWIINTLLSKITTAMHVTKEPRYCKLFDENGMLEQSFSPNDTYWSNLMRGSELGDSDSDSLFSRGRDSKSPKDDLSSDKGEEEVWIATLNPIFDMLRVADPMLGEIPNVRVVQTEGISVYALKGGIRKGQALLRQRGAETFGGVGVGADWDSDGNGVGRRSGGGVTSSEDDMDVGIQ